MLRQLHYKQHEGITIVLALIDCVEKVTMIADASNDVQKVRPSRQSGLVPNAFGKPPTLPDLCKSDHTLINIDNLLLGLHPTDEVTGSMLSLELGSNRVVVHRDRAELSIRHIQPLLEIPIDHGLAETQLHCLLDVPLDIRDLDRAFRLLKEL